jgi:hypothetical protein
MSAPSAPSPVPTMSLVPCAQSMSMVAPSPEVLPQGNGNDASMGSHPATLTPLPAAPKPQSVCTDADFLKVFSWNLGHHKYLNSWLQEAAHCQLPWGHLVTAIRTTGHTDKLSNPGFIDYVHVHFPST